MTLTAAYADDLSRVRLSIASPPAGADTALIERSLDGLVWVQVRGGQTVALNGAAHLDDYEFAPNVLNHYRATYMDGTAPLGADTTTITPNLTRVWIKNLQRPYLNRPVTVTDWSDIRRTARAGIFQVIGRTSPVAVTDVRGSRTYTLTVTTATLAEAADLDAVLVAGEPILLHVPDGCPFPGMYAVIGDTSESRHSKRTLRRFFDLPLTEVAAPDPTIIGETVLWADIISSFATWSDLVTAEPTWSDVLDRIGSPTDVITG